MRFYIDEHVPSSITAGLRQRDVDVLTVQEDGYDGKEDHEVFDRSVELGRLIYSQDDDFLAESKCRQISAATFPGVVYCHQMWLTIGQRVIDLEVIAKYGEPDEYVDRVTYLPLR